MSAIAMSSNGKVCEDTYSYNLNINTIEFCKLQKSSCPVYRQSILTDR